MCIYKNIHRCTVNISNNLLMKSIAEIGFEKQNYP